MKTSTEGQVFDRVRLANRLCNAHTLWVRTIFVFLLVLTASFSLRAQGVECAPEVRVIGHGEVAHLAPRMQNKAAELYEKARLYTGAESCERITVHLVKDTPEAKLLLPAWHLPPWAAGAARPEERTAFVTVLTDGSPTNQERVMLHELAHIAIADAAKGRRVPRWFDEGASRRIAGEDGQDDDRVLARAKIQKQMFSLEGLSLSFPGDSAAAALAYAVSGRAIELIEAKNPNAVREVLKSLENEEDFESLFAGVTGRPVWRLSGDVERSVSATHAWMSILREGELLMPLIGFLFIAFSIHAMRKRRAQKETMDDAVTPGLLAAAFGVHLHRWSTGRRRLFQKGFNQEGSRFIVH